MSAAEGAHSLLPHATLLLLSLPLLPLLPLLLLPVPVPLVLPLHRLQLPGAAKPWLAAPPYCPAQRQHRLHRARAGRRHARRLSCV